MALPPRRKTAGSSRFNRDQQRLVPGMFPSLQSWLRFEGAGVVDSCGRIKNIARINPGASDLPGDGALHLSPVSPGQRCEALMSDTALDLNGGNTFWFEIDFTPWNHFADQANVLGIVAEISDVDSATSGGVRIGINLSAASTAAASWSASLSIKSASASARSDASGAAFNNQVGGALGQRHHMLLAVDTSGNIRPGYLHFVGFLNGVFYASEVKVAAGSVLSGNYSTGSGKKIIIGNRTALDRVSRCDFHNIRIWSRPGPIDRNLHAIALDLYLNRDVLPTLMR